MLEIKAETKQNKIYTHISCTSHNNLQVLEELTAAAKQTLDTLEQESLKQGAAPNIGAAYYQAFAARMHSEAEKKKNTRAAR